MNRFLTACRREPVDRPPVWVMRQAGRYLPEYREVRHEPADFLDHVPTPELAAEVTLQPIRRFGFDAAILFSDILTPLVPMGAEVTFSPGAAHRNPVRDAADVERSRFPTVDAAPTSSPRRSGSGRPGRETALIGFCGAPWTLATYLVEGSASRAFTHVKSFALNHPEAFDDLVDRLADAMAAYLRHPGRARRPGGPDLRLVGRGSRARGRAALGAAPARRLLDQLDDLAGSQDLLRQRRLPPSPRPSRHALRGDRPRLARRPRRGPRRCSPTTPLQGNLDPGSLMGPDDEIRRRTLAMLARHPAPATSPTWATASPPTSRSTRRDLCRPCRTSRYE